MKNPSDFLTLLRFKPSVLVHGTWLVVLLLSEPALGQFVPLFNGVDLTGWHVVGGTGTYSVESGEIVGRSTPGSPNTFLVTDQEYTDFVLELDFQIFDTSFNSGVQLRSQSLPNHNNGNLFGYQVEIDPSSRAWSGGIYFEGGSPARGAGWLADLSDNPTAQAAFLLGQWNHFRIVAQGRRITTWLNGVPAVDYLDLDSTAFLPNGVIGLQVHSNSSPTPLEVRWRNLLIDELVPGSNVTIGDFSGDGSVSLSDYVILIENLHRDISNLTVPEAYLSGDLTGDAKVTYEDFRELRDIYINSTSLATFLVPEPTTALLLLLGGTLCLRRSLLRAF